MDSEFVTTAPDTLQALPTGANYGYQQQSNAREFVRTLQSQTEQLSRVNAAAARVNTEQSTFRIVLMAKIEGVRMVTDLCNAAIQKSNIN